MSNPYDIKSCLDLLDKHAPKAPTRSTIGMTADEVRAATRKNRPARPSQPRFVVALDAMHASRIERLLPFVQSYREYRRKGDGSTVAEFCKRNGFEPERCIRFLEDVYGNQAPSYEELKALANAMRGRIKG